jgi:hypothetical protein
MKCIVKVANKLSISEKTKHQAINIVSEAVKMEIFCFFIFIEIMRQK